MYALSIIIPIYNVEDTLRRCLMSVLSQVDDTMEVVLIAMVDGFFCTYC